MLILHQVRCKQNKKLVSINSYFIALYFLSLRSFKATFNSPLFLSNTTEEGGYLALIVVIGVVLVAFSSIIFVIFVVAMKNLRKRKRQQKPTTDTPIIRPTTGNYRQWQVSMQCSFRRLSSKMIYFLTKTKHEVIWDKIPVM